MLCHKLFKIFWIVKSNLKVYLALKKLTKEHVWKLNETISISLRYDGLVNLNYLVAEPIMLIFAQLKAGICI